MKILIATDGSDYSDAAIRECCKMVVDPKNVEILIVSVYDDTYPLATEPFAMSPEYYQQLEDGIREQTTSVVEAARKLVADQFPDAGFSIETEVLRGSPDQQITEKAKEWNADLIVVGSHGRGFWGRLLGSVSNGVMHHAPCSVMVVRKP